MKTKFTPGPWKVIDGDSSGGWDEPGEYEYRVITEDPEPRPSNILASFWDSDFGYEAWANACLIAAAPDLLEACQIALSALDDPDPQAYKHAMNKCEAAIEKVTSNG